MTELICFTGHGAQKTAQRVPDQIRRLAPALHQGCGEVGQLLHQVRPVAGDGVARIVTKAVNRMDVKTTFTQQGKQQAVGASRKAVGVREDQGLHARGGGARRPRLPYTSFSSGVVIFLTGLGLSITSGTVALPPNHCGSSMLSKAARRRSPQLLRSI